MGRLHSNPARSSGSWSSLRFLRGRTDKDRTDALNLMLLRWAVNKGLPFHAFDDPFFLEWMRHVRPTYKTPGGRAGVV